MPFRVGGKGGGEGGAIAVPNDLRFSGADLAACITARNTFFTNNPSRLVKDVKILLEPVGQPVGLQMYDGSAWRDVTNIVKGNQGDPASNLVQSVQGRTGNVTITKNDLSLQNVDNTSDLNKPISSAVQTALDAKANTVHTHSKANITDLESDLNTINTALSNLNTNKQDKLTSGTTIKTVNGNSLLGSGNIVIDAVQEATSAVTGGIRLTGDLGGSALSPSVTKINGVAVSNTGIAAGKVLKATSGNTAVFDNITAADVGAIPTSAKGVIDGVAELDGNGKLPSARLPAGIVQSVNGLTGIVTITKNTLSLGSVDNTADADKPLSNDAKTALNLKVDKSTIGANSGVCELDGNGKIPSSRISALPTGETFVVANAAARLALSAAKGDVAIQQDTEESYRLKDVPATLPTNWVKLLFPASVQSVNSKTGNVTITKADLNLGNVDNTSDLGKPISADTQTALNTKVDKTVLSAKGSLLTHSGSALAPHAVGTDGQVLKSDSTSPTGLKWETLPAALTINNTLTSDATNEPLSAAQGKVLKNLVDTKAGTAVATTSTNGLMSSTDKTKLDGLANTTVVDGLTDTSATKALSANQGKVLKDLVDTKASKTLVSGTQTITMLADGGENVDVEHINCIFLEQDVIPAIGDFVKSGQTWATADTSIVNIVPDGPNGYIISLSKPTTFQINDGDQLQFVGAGVDGLMSKNDKIKLDSLSNTVVNDTLTSTSTTEAASARTVKVAYDVAMSKPHLATGTLPVGFGTAALGTSSQAAKADHVHPTPPNATADSAPIYSENAALAASGSKTFTLVANAAIEVGMVITGHSSIAANTKVTAYNSTTKVVDFDLPLSAGLPSVSPLSFTKIGNDGFISKQDQARLNSMSYWAAAVGAVSGRSPTSDGLVGVSATAARSDHSHRVEYKQGNAYTSGQIAWLGNMPVIANGTIPANTVFAWNTTGATWSALLAPYFTWKGVYTSGVAYAQNDVVTHSSAHQSPLMVVTTAHTASGNLLATTRAVGAANSGTTTPLVHSSASNWGEWMMVGANGSRQGVAGIVPAPNAGLVDRFLRSDGAWAPVGAACKLMSQADGWQTIPHNTVTTVNLPLTAHNTDSGIFTVVSGTIRVNFKGVYRISCTLAIDNNNAESGRRTLICEAGSVTLGSVNDSMSSSGYGDISAIHYSTTHECAANDIIRLRAFTNGGSTRSLKHIFGFTNDLTVELIRLT